MSADTTPSAPGHAGPVAHDTLAELVASKTVGGHTTGVPGRANLPARPRRLPTLRVATIAETGPACLAAVLVAYGRPTPVHSVIKSWPGTTTGILLAATEAGRALGLEIVPQSSGADGLRELPGVLLVCWGERFALLERRRLGRPRRLVDPLDRRPDERALRASTLRRNPPDFVMNIGLAPSFWPAHERRQAQPWLTVVRQLRGTAGLRSLLGSVAALSILLMVMGFSGPVLTKVLVDEVLPQRVHGVLPVVAAGLGLLALTRLLADYLRGRLLVLTAGYLDSKLMTSFLAHLLTLPFSFFKEHSTGDVVQRFTSNVMLRNALTQQTVGGIIDGLLVVVYAGALFWIDPTFGMLAMAIGAVQVAVLLVPARRIGRMTRDELEQVGRTQTFTVELVTGAAYVKASGAETGMLDVGARLLAAQIDASMRRRRFLVLLSSTSSTVSALSSAALLLVGVGQVIDGSMTLGTALALLSLATSFLTPLATLIGSLQQLQAVQGYAERITDVISSPGEQAEDIRVPLGPLAGRVEMRDVGFRYPDSPRWALRNVSLTLEPGARLAVVGPSGSGKSTLGFLLLGLLQPDEGCVLVDGRDLREVDLPSFRRQCGVVLQDPVLFDGTVRDNVAFHNDQLTDGQITDAIKQACLDATDAPLGLDTPVGERGTTLSGGQRQRLALARALARNPRLLVLDEATGALDTTTEAEVIRRMRTRRCSTFVVAHRLSSVRDADHIIVLDGGRVVERGAHSELMSQVGVYARLVADAEDTSTRTDT